MKNFRNIINKFALLLAGSAMFVSCNDYLDEMPDNRTTIDSPEKVTMMLVSAYPEVLPLVVLEQMSDNTDDRGKKFNVSNDLWEDAYRFQHISSTSTDSPEEIWNATYRAIAAANHALEGIEKMIASGKATAEEIAAFYAAGETSNSLTLAPRITVAEGTQNGLVQACLHARRIATLHEGDRILDLKRYGVAFTHVIDGDANIEIEPFDKRLAVQLPAAVISAGIPGNPR